MSFRKLLIHQATFNNKVAEQQEKDEYGRPIAAAATKLNVPCRVDDLSSSRTNDEKGVDYVERYALFCFPDSGIGEETTIENITDRSGNIILDGKFLVAKLKPRFRRSRLHHIEAEIKRS